MDIQFRQVSSALEKLEVFSLRKKVFVEEENRFPYSMDQIVDPYDSFKETINFAAVLNDEMIAVTRLTLDSAAGLPVDKYEGIEAFKKSLTGRCCSIGWLCCKKQHRHNKGLLKSLVRQALLYARGNGARHMISVIHPPVYDMMHHCFRVEKIGSEFIDDQRSIPMLAVYARISTMLHALEEDSTEQSRPGALTEHPDFQGKYHFLEEALSRNIGIFSLAEQDRLTNCRIAIPGLGGVGGQHLVTLMRTGINNFNIADFDEFEPVNFNRQYGAKTSQFGQAKIDVMYKEAMDINPYADIRCFAQGISRDTVDDFLKNVDLVADGMDFFNFDMRRLIFNKAYEKKIPVVTAGPLGFSAALLIFMPDEGMTFDQYFDINDTLELEEKLIRFFIGLAPKASQSVYIDADAISMENKKGPSVGAACQMCSAVAATEAVRILLNKGDVKPAPHYFQYDLFTRKFYFHTQSFQLIQHLFVFFGLKKIDDTFSYFRADFIYVGQLFVICIFNFIKRMKFIGQQSGNVVAHVPDSKCI